jgi:hypothetical protein
VVVEHDPGAGGDVRSLAAVGRGNAERVGLLRALAKIGNAISPAAFLVDDDNDGRGLRGT